MWSRPDCKVYHAQESSKSLKLPTTMVQATWINSTTSREAMTALERARSEAPKTTFGQNHFDPVVHIIWNATLAMFVQEDSVAYWVQWLALISTDLLSQPIGTASKVSWGRSSLLRNHGASAISSENCQGDISNCSVWPCRSWDIDLWFIISTIKTIIR